MVTHTFKSDDGERVMFNSLQDQVTELEDRIDKLHADFSAQSKAQVDLEDTIRDLEHEVACQGDLASKAKGGEKSKHKQIHLETTRKLQESRSQLEQLRLKKGKTSDWLEEAQTDLSKKQMIQGAG